MGFTNSVIRALRSVLASADDPRDLSAASAIRRQELLLARVRAEAADLESARAGLDDRAQRLAAEREHLLGEARRLVDAGLEGPARDALRRRALAGHCAAQVKEEAVRVAAVRDHIGGIENKLAARVEALRSDYDVAAARLAAAGSQNRVAGALEDVGPELSGLGDAFAAAAKESEASRARARDLEGVVEARVGPGSQPMEDQIEAELNALKSLS